RRSRPPGPGLAPFGSSRRALRSSYLLSPDHRSAALTDATGAPDDGFALVGRPPDHGLAIVNRSPHDGLAVVCGAPHDRLAVSRPAHRGQAPRLGAITAAADGAPDDIACGPGK